MQPGGYLDSRLVLEYVAVMLVRRVSFAFSALVLAGLVASCGGPTYPKCENDDHCAEKGELCVEGTCQQCRTDGNCGDGEQCTGGRCEQKPECAANDDCPGNQICRSGMCKTECNGASDCGSGQKCMANRCVAENACSTDTDCGTGEGCRSGRCEVIEASRSLSTCTYPTVRFSFNESTLTPEARAGLQEVADCIQSGGGTLRIEGHCDERGTEEYNLSLGDRRARAVMDYLKRLGVPTSKMRVVSMGEAAPIDDRSTESAWAKNRRAEFEAED